MFKELEPEHKPKFKVYWYTGKDMCRPINASKKQRNCHVKIMIVDDYIGIQGNGNQGTFLPIVRWQLLTGGVCTADRRTIVVPLPGIEYPHRLAGRMQRMGGRSSMLVTNLTPFRLCIIIDFRIRAANQNTHIYGRLDDDGIWRDPKDGSLLEDMGSTHGGGLSGTLKGLSGALKRVQ